MRHEPADHLPRRRLLRCSRFLFGCLGRAKHLEEAVNEAQLAGPEYAEGIRQAARVVHAEARWQTEQRLRLAQISTLRADTQFGYSLNRLAELEATLLSLADTVQPTPPSSGVRRVLDRKQR
jgi:hypothetical protein